MDLLALLLWLTGQTPPQQAPGTVSTQSGGIPIQPPPPPPTNLKN